MFAIMISPLVIVFFSTDFLKYFSANLSSLSLLLELRW